MSDVEAEVARLAEQRMRAAVNFGVVSLRRASGTATDELLELRCECGRPGCAAVVTISIRDYQAASFRHALLVSPGHVNREHDLQRIETAHWVIIG